MAHKLAIIGNPNIGKSSLFNRLTGLQQKIGNFAGVTTEKKSGFFSENGIDYELVDLPGTYSLVPKSPDEEVVFSQLVSDEASKPEAIIVVLDASNLERNLILFSQIADLQIPTVVAVNMLDVAESRSIKIDLIQLTEILGCPIIATNARTGAGLLELKTNIKNATIPKLRLFYPLEFLTNSSEEFKTISYTSWLHWVSKKAEKASSITSSGLKAMTITTELAQAKETVYRYQKIKSLLKSFDPGNDLKSNIGYKFDAVALHPFWGYVLMLGVLLVIFEAIFQLSSYPMDLIEGLMAAIIDGFNGFLPDGLFKRLFLEGILAGIQGIIIFVPQIAILFFLIGLLEESGYMARVMILLDRLMKKIGLSGKAIIPLVSGVACAVPAIMATRNMTNSRERLIAIFVTPLMSCSARLPVFTLLIGMLLSEAAVFGPFSMQGLVLFAMYLVGLLGAVVTAWILDKLLPTTGKTPFLLEIPPYQIPHWRNLWYSVFQKSKAFVFEAGKVILAISVLLWLMAGFGPGDSIEKAEEKARTEMAENHQDEAELNRQIGSAKLEASYAGIAGRWIEPVLKPMGFDWKIGVALITSFAAREVFVGTMSVLYASGNEGETELLKTRMRMAKNPETGKPVFNTASILSLLVFYIFAMQCMSTLAVSYRETASWKWPFLQLVYMTGLAFGASTLVFQALK